MSKFKLNYRKYLIYALLVLGILLISGFIIYFYHINKSIQISDNQDMLVESIDKNGIILSQECSKTFVDRKADYIIEGTLGKVSVGWNQIKTSNSIDADFNIEKFIKGRPFRVNSFHIIDTLIFDQPLESLDNVFGINNRPVFNQGAHVRIYFSVSDNKLNIICGKYGIEEI